MWIWPGVNSVAQTLVYAWAACASHASPGYGEWPHYCRVKDWNNGIYRMLGSPAARPMSVSVDPDTPDSQIWEAREALNHCPLRRAEGQWAPPAEAAGNGKQDDGFSGQWSGTMVEEIQERCVIEPSSGHRCHWHQSLNNTNTTRLLRNTLGMCVKHQGVLMYTCVHINHVFSMVQIDQCLAMHCYSSQISLEASTSTKAISTHLRQQDLTSRPRGQVLLSGNCIHSAKNTFCHGYQLPWVIFLLAVIARWQ